MGEDPLKQRHGNAADGASKGRKRDLMISTHDRRKLASTTSSDLVSAYCRLTGHQLQGLSCFP